MVSRRNPAPKGAPDTTSTRLPRQSGRGRGLCSFGSLQRQADAEQGAAAFPALDPDATAHQRGEPAHDGEPEACPFMTARGRDIGLLEFLENRLPPLLRDAGAGIGDVDDDHPVVSADADADAALVGELDRVADKVQQDLPDAVAITDEMRRQVGREMGCEFDALDLGARGHQLRDRLDQHAEIEGLAGEFELAGLHLREVEDVVHEAEQRLARGSQRPDIGRLLGVETGVAEQIGHAEDTVERRAEFMADGGEEARLRLIGAFGPGAGLDQLLLGCDPGGDVAPDALQHTLAERDGHNRLNPGDPALALRSREAFVEDAGATLQRLGGSRSDEPRLGIRANDVGLSESGQGGIGTVRIDDAGAVAPHDQVALRLDQAAIVLLAIGERPEAVVQGLDITGQFRRLPHDPLALAQQQDGRDCREHGKHHQRNRGPGGRGRKIHAATLAAAC